MVRPGSEGDRRRALELAPEDLVREIFIFGGPEEQRERLGEFVARGDHDAGAHTGLPAGAGLRRLLDALGAMSDGLAVGPDGVARCWWGASSEEYAAYHDSEWGGPVRDDRGLYEKLCLEAFQSGLSWLTILRKRESFRAAFAGFEIARVAAFGDDDVARLMADAGIVRNRAKIDAAIANARAALEVDLTPSCCGRSPPSRGRVRGPAPTSPPSRRSRRRWRRSSSGAASASSARRPRTR